MSFKKYDGKSITARGVDSVLNGEGTQRDRLQNAIEATIEHAKLNNNDFTLLSRLVNGLKERRTRNLQALTKYIGEHLTGASWQKLGDGSYGYKTTKGKAVEYKTIEKPWYAHSANKQQVHNFDLSQRLKTLIRDVDAAIKGDKKTQMSKQQLNDAKAQLVNMEQAFEA